jgi:putative flippase GtrA
VKTFLHRLLVRDSNHVVVQLVRYGLVAASSFAIDFVLLVVLTEKAHWFYLWSATLSFLISLAYNYVLSVAWAFSNQSAHSRHKEMVLFLVVGLVALGLNDLGIWVLTAGFGIYYLISKLAATLLVFFWSFGARRYLIFSAPKLQAE